MNLEARFEDDNIMNAFSRLFNTKAIMERHVPDPLLPDVTVGDEDLSSDDMDSDNINVNLDPSTDSHPQDAFCAVLAKTFGLNVADTESEHEQFEQLCLVDENMRERSLGEVVDVLCTNKSLKALFPLMSRLAGSYKVLPPHTADCEYDFSKLGIIKTKLRNGMSQKTLDALMRISIHSSSVGKAPLERAVKKWAILKNHRLKV